MLNEISELRQRLIEKEAELTALQDRCTHSWGQVKYHAPTPIDVSKEIRAILGTTSWPIPMRDAKWTRKCQYCLKVETTTRARLVKPAEVTPDFEPEKPLSEQEKMHRKLMELGH